ncbi:exodeoxyribonuclease VII large subunit [Arcanobacterium hippocoleae]|uniref:exodeoxyribonuclease VII large subunit n=1 Tax=Arcanobacterium hippocoleae TaxID=149017 RepID=UPI00333FAF97
MKQQTPIPSHLPQLAAHTTPEQPWPLRLLSTKIAEYVSKMSRLWVEGEIITLVRRPNAKVQFFTLADLEEKVSINVKIFSHALPAGIESGSRVVICAKPDFWAGNGSLALCADEVRAVGIGEILARIEQLKQRLAAEGLFAANRKLPSHSSRKKSD